jgi:hypothetical protein
VVPPDGQIAVRMDEDVDVFREPMDQLISLRQGRAALELEGEAARLQPPESLHDPVVLLHQAGVYAHLAGKDLDQIAEVRGIMQEDGHDLTRPPALG